MGKEVLAIPEEHVADVVRVLRAGLAVENVPAEVREALEAWCFEYEACPESGEIEAQCIEEPVTESVRRDEREDDLAGGPVADCGLCTRAHHGAMVFGQHEVDEERTVDEPAPKGALFAVDFDGTFTRDPVGFGIFVEVMKARGHRFVLVTGRSDEGQFGAEVRRAVGDLMPIVFAGARWKRDAAIAEGYEVDIWIDDHAWWVAEQKGLRHGVGAGGTSKPKFHVDHTRFWKLEELRAWLRQVRPGALRIVEDFEHKSRERTFCIDYGDRREDMLAFPDTYAKAGESVEDLDWLMTEFGREGQYPLIWIQR